ncbi:MAG: hypothetical protein M0R49_01160 [Limnochordia bacterium]|nr:hypothetical protein [Limnochordia bacterium]
MILPCTCQHEFQDRQYGNGMRVHNLAVNINSKNGGYRCTVCQKEKARPTGDKGTK